MTLAIATEKPRSIFDKLSETPGLLQRIVWTALISGGAGLVLASLIVDHFGPASGQLFGPKQIAGLAVGLVSIAIGVALQIRAEPHRVAEIAKFWAVVAQVALVVYVIGFFHIENSAFSNFIAPLVLCGFVVHHYLPAQMRMPFFLLLSLAGIYGVFGTANPATFFTLVGGGLALFGACHLPIALWARISLIAAITAVLVLLRTGHIETTWAAAAVPVLASMFMFRLAIYLYDRHNNKGPTSIWTGLSYFFMLPNVVFPFFPVVDYSTFGRTHYNDEAHRIYQRGAGMIVRGIVHLLLYRIVNYYFVLPPEEVVGAGTFFQFVVANYALYLRISGLFHLIIGLLLLFGFNLPETHVRYFFANSFVDYWRRINIYWKDFMQKMVFNPSYMRVKGFGLSHASSVVLAILAVFFATWALHAYAWFWLRGTFILRLEDMMFWAILAVFLVVQTMREANPANKKLKASPQSFLVSQALLAVRTACTFFTICLLWSLWTSESVPGWLQLWDASGLVPAFNEGLDASGGDWILTLATLAAVSLMAAVAAGFFVPSAPPARAAKDQKARADDTARASQFYRSALATVAACLLLTQIPNLAEPFGAGAQDVAHTIRETRLNARDQALLERGYYQQLTNVNRMNSQLWEIYMNRQAVAITVSPVERKRADYLRYDHVPSTSKMVHEARYDINRWGMRDDDYALAKEPGTYRIALIGSSRAIGWGIGVEDRYESILERRLNHERPGAKDQKYEILNFAVDGYLPVQELITFESKAIPFKPDAVIYEAGPRDLLVDHEAQMFKKGVASPYPFVNEILREAGIHREMSIEQITRLLWPYRFELLEGTYKRIVDVAQEHGIKPAWAYIPNLEADETRQHRDYSEMKRIALKVGFTTIDLYDVFDDVDHKTLKVFPWDNHPNEKGHRLISDSMYARMGDILGRPTQ